MTDLEAQACAYASQIIKSFLDEEVFDREVVFYVVRDAYLQGWKDSRTKGKKPDAPDCRYFSDGFCSKGLPGTFCERKGCEAYNREKDADKPQKTRK